MHGLSYWVCISKSWRSCTFLFLPNFVAETQNHSIYGPHLEELTVPSLADFVDGNRDEMLLFPNRTLKRYLTIAKQFRPECAALVSSSRQLKGRNGCPEIPLGFGVN